MLGLPYNIQEIAQIISAKDLFQGQIRPQPVTRISFDSRTISHGASTLFLALSTPNRDGHDFIGQAIEKGVRNFLVDRPLPHKNINYAICNDPLESLQLWARHHRNRFPYPVIAITGSNGKTIVKEWLATILEIQYQIVKSPMSYNSQLGVPLALLQMHPLADLAIIEAGISQVGEMDRLRRTIQPTQGILTHIGPAHASGFSSEQEKLAEKIQLFDEVNTLYATSFQPEIRSVLSEKNLNLKTVGYLATDHLRILTHSVDLARRNLTLTYDSQQLDITLPVVGEADMENALLAILVALEWGIPSEMVQERVALLHPVQMRTEMITDNPEITLINDSYNSDPDSVRNAFQLLLQTQAQPLNQIILTDIPHLGEIQKPIQQALLKEAVELVGSSHVRVIGPVFAEMDHPLSYATTDALIRDLSYGDFRNSTVLLKGARNFQLERIIPLLNPKLNATYLKINLNALVHNFRYLKSHLPEGTRIMCMVKAASYGSGTWEIAQELVKEGADYLAVAYASEGIDLRNANIRIPIMVMNPDLSSTEALIRYEIEPEISNFPFLHQYIRAAHLAGKSEYRIHLKLETGMERMGFTEEQLDELISVILKFPDINVVSVMSHLAAADDPEEDAFTLSQIERFQRMYRKLQTAMGLHSFRHILNTAGILRFPDAAMEMVRMGIGLYGIHPLSDTVLNDSPVSGLQEMGSMHSLISQIHSVAAGTSIGYSRSQYAARKSRIATIPVGYADGIPRSLSNGKFAFLVRGRFAPIVGKVCMDMLMLDVTDIPEALPGDDVVIFGQQGDAFSSISDLAKAADTIPYEILVRISSRVRRIYSKE